ncbi:MAG: TetR/AcrR family transcriptional regulator [Caldilineaceae bacterium]
MASHLQTIFPLVVNTEALAAKPERADAQENRTRILAAAEALFHAQGVNNVNMVDIARAAGVGQGTLYRRFASKGELCLALLDTQMRDFQDQTLAQFNAMGTDGQAYLAQLAWFINAWVHFQAHHSLLLCAVSQDFQVEDHPHSPPFLWQRMTIHGLLRRAANARKLRPMWMSPSVQMRCSLCCNPISCASNRKSVATHRPKWWPGFNASCMGCRHK